MKTSELTGAALDWAVAKCEGAENLNSSYTKGRGFCIRGGDRYSPSTDWSQGGPIIKREGINLLNWVCGWDASMTSGSRASRRVNGDTPLIAAMRCYVASKMGDEVDIPAELIG